jgi:hypothetical protein
MEALIERVQREKGERRDQIKGHYAGGVREFRRFNGAVHQHAIVTPDAQEPEKWRVTRYDKDGFSGHSVHATEEEALHEVADDRYLEPAHGSLEALSGQPEWAESMDRNARMQAEHARRMKGEE